MLLRELTLSRQTASRPDPPGHIFIKHANKRTDALPQDLVRSRSREIGCYNDHIALKFESSAAVDAPIKYQSDWKSLNPNLASSRLEILW